MYHLRPTIAHLTHSDCYQLLRHYFPFSFITPAMTQALKQTLLQGSACQPRKIFIDPLTWIEFQVQEFCTPDVNRGFTFEQHSSNRHSRSS